jgi:hypothetical protein
MSISIRLEKPIEEALRKQIKTQKATLSAFVRDAILEKIEREKNARPNPYELGKALFGRYKSGSDDLSTNRKAILKEKVRAKHRH